MELNPVKGLGKLNAAQLSAAKRRANMGPAQPFLPSKDGFRVSAHEAKTAAPLPKVGHGAPQP